MRIAIITINKAGQKLAKKLKADFKEAKIFNGQMDSRGSLKNLVKSVFNQYDGLIFIAALGITVRLIAPLVRNKLTDPAVVSVDSAGRFAISALSGHEGGANRLAFLVAKSLNASPVVTTGEEVNKRFVLGIGTRRGISSNKVKKAIKQALAKKAIGLEQIRIAATIELKKNERGLIKGCSDLGLPLVFIPKDSLRDFKGSISISPVARRHLDLDGVCEPCALLSGRRAKLVLKKEIQGGVTIAIARENYA